jgi:hypothetical protein
MRDMVSGNVRQRYNRSRSLHKSALKAYGRRVFLPKRVYKMGWLAAGVAYSVLYAVVGAYLRPFPNVLPWFRIVALLVPPLAGVAIIARRRHSWAGCQWLFWATLALGLLMSGISVIGWSVDEMMLGVGTSWLGWHAVFALFGGVAPLLALLAQPHRGPREKVTATIAVGFTGEQAACSRSKNIDRKNVLIAMLRATA